MDNDKIVQQVMAELQRQSGSSGAPSFSSATKDCSLTEFVGIASGDTIGLVLANVDPGMRKMLDISDQYRSIGLVGSRIGAGPQAMAADEAVKASNSEVIRLELPRDTKGGPGHGIMIVFGAEEVSDAKKAVETTLGSLERTMGGVYVNDAGHVEVQYTARAGQVLSKYFGAHLGKAFGIVGAAPAVIGIVAADALLKAADVEIISAMSPTKGCSFSNEYIVTFAGDSGAVKQAAVVGRDVSLQALGAMGAAPKCVAVPYL
jgi:microcompartment protein PduB